MNKHTPTSASFPRGAQCTRSEQEVRDARSLSMLGTIERCAGYRGMSDDQLANELAAKEKLANAVEDMWRAISAVNHGSSCVKIDTNAFADFIHDELPTETYWQERIRDSRA